LSLCKVDNWLPLQHGVEAQIVTLFYKFRNHLVLL
jgi:hypothetical protein